MKKILLAWTLLLIQNSFGAHIQSKGKVEFLAKGFPTFITIQGKGDQLKGEMDISGNKVNSGKFQFPLSTLKTGMDLRDEHMHEKYLESKKYPNAVLTLEPFNLDEEGTAKGKLSLHNKEKNIEVTYKRLSENPLQIEAEFKLLLEDYGIDIPSFQGITVAKEIKIKVNLGQ